jgi:hypothetical protein
LLSTRIRWASRSARFERRAVRRLHIVYLCLLVVALVAAIGWSFADSGSGNPGWVEVWAPHICMTAVELLVAAAVLDRWTRLQERIRRAPLQKAAREGIGTLLTALGTKLAIQRAYLGAPPQATASADDAFDATQWGVALPAATSGWLDGWQRDVDRGIGTLESSLGRFEEVLSPLCAAAAWRLISEWEMGAGARLRARATHARALATRLGRDAGATRLDQATQDDVIVIVAKCRDLWHAFQEAEQETVALDAGIEATLRLINVARMSEASGES